jgi:hypothetical protein
VSSLGEFAETDCRIDVIAKNCLGGSDIAIQHQFDAFAEELPAKLRIALDPGADRLLEITCQKSTQYFRPVCPSSSPTAFTASRNFYLPFKHGLTSAPCREPWLAGCRIEANDPFLRDLRGSPSQVSCPTRNRPPRSRQKLFLPNEPSMSLKTKDHSRKSRRFHADL